MNKLYIINVYFKHTELLLGTLTAWSFDAIEKKRRDLEKSGLHFSLIENNEIHMIYYAR